MFSQQLFLYAIFLQLIDTIAIDLDCLINHNQIKTLQNKTHISQHISDHIDTRTAVASDTVSHIITF